MSQDFVVIDGVKYVVDDSHGIRVLRTKGHITGMIARANQSKVEFNAPIDSEIERLTALLDKFPG